MKTVLKKWTDVLSVENLFFNKWVDLVEKEVKAMGLVSEEPPVVLDTKPLFAIFVGGKEHQ